MGIILNIDTSSEVCSVCLSDKGSLISEKTDMKPNQHASSLTSLIMRLLDDTGVVLKDLSAVALSSGPGSYTGLRIGTSVAKGLCYGLDIPMIGVSTLQGLAYRMAEEHPDKNGIYIPMIDARRDDVYMAIYDCNNNIIKKDTFVTVNSGFQDILTAYDVKNIYFAGTGGTKTGKINPNGEFGTVIENIICIAKNINAISYKHFSGEMFVDLASYEPFYLKEFEGRMGFK